MSDNWVVQNLENALNTWNEKLAEIWQLITQSPQQFKGGAIWGVIVDIHGALQAIGLALLVLFFVVGVMKTCGPIISRTTRSAIFTAPSRARMWAKASSSPMRRYVWRARLSCWPVSSSRCSRHPRRRLIPMRRQFRWYGAISESWSLICWFSWAL